MVAGAAVMLGAAGPGAVCAADEPTSAPGQYDVGVSTRKFDSPLFGNDLSTTYRFFGRQSFTTSGDYQVWLNGGAANSITHYGMRGDGFAAGSQILGFGAGDFWLESTQPNNQVRGLSGSSTLRGANFHGTGEGFSWNIFAGKTVYDIGLPSSQGVRPFLYGAQSLLTRGRNSFGADLIVVDDAPYADATRTGDRDVVLTGRYFRQLSPWTNLFSEVSGATEGSGARLGAGVRLLRGEISGSIYAFDDSESSTTPATTQFTSATNCVAPRAHR